ncbi:MAG TPA: hypothetical protein VLB47_08905 [Solirubrobacteraceae bacterium]|nr:hypothetical protein [Solirubrobacteraceae bacterium]
MAKAVQDDKLYDRMRASGIRKKVARRLAELPAHVDGGKLVPKPLREAVERLDATVSELRGHVGRGDRAAAGRKAARTRRAQGQKRSAAARKGARRRT